MTQISRHQRKITENTATYPFCDPDLSASEENNRKYNNIPFFAIQISRHQRKITENTTTYRLFVIQISRHQRKITENTTTCLFCDPDILASEKNNRKYNNIPFFFIQISRHQRKITENTTTYPLLVIQIFRRQRKRTQLRQSRIIA